MAEGEEQYLKHSFMSYLKIDNVYTVFFNSMRKNYSSAGESHGFYEFIYTDRGELLVEIDGEDGRETLKLEQGWGYLHPPNQFHRHYVTNQMKSTVCIVSFDCNDEVLKQIAKKVLILTTEQKAYLAKIMGYAAKIFKTIYEENQYFKFFKFESYNHLIDQMFQNTLELMFLDMIVLADGNARIRSGILKDQASETLVEDIKDYLKQSIYDKVSIADICAKFSYSKTTISNKFKDVTGMSIIHYFQYLKVEEAVELIESGSLNITSIAAMLNFSSCQYFSLVFKSILGVNPRAYKKSITNKENVKYNPSKNWGIEKNSKHL